MGIQDLFFRVRAVDESAAALTKLRYNVEQTSGAIGKLAGAGGALRSVFMGFGAGLGFGAISAISQIPRVLGDMVDKASGLVHVADRIGITTDKLQELHFSAKLADVDVDALDKGLQTFARTIGTALTGSGDFAKILKANGVALRDNAGHVRSTNDLLGAYANLIRGASSEEEKLFLARAAFGKSGDDLVDVFSNGAAAMDKEGRAAHDLGGVLDEQLLRKAEKIGDEWTKFTTSLTTAFQTFVLTVVQGSATAIEAIVTMIGKSSAAVADGLAYFQRTTPGAGARPNESGLLSVVPGRSSPTDKRGFPDRSFTQFTSGLAGAAYAGPMPDRSFTQFTSGLAGADFKRTVLPPSEEVTKAAADIKKVTDALKLQSAQLMRTARDQFIYNELEKAGVTATSAIGKEITASAGALYDQQQALQKTITLLDNVRDLARSTFQGIISDLRQGKSAAEIFANAIGNIADKLASAGIDNLVDALLGAKGTGAGGGGLLTGLIGGLGHLFGFAGGGDFVVGGAGGVDSKIVAFRGSPGERVSIRTPGQGAAGGGGGPMHILLELNSELLDARIVRASAPVAIEVFRNGQKASQRRQVLAG